MKTRPSVKALCFEHGSITHLTNGTEDALFDFGQCTRCLVLFLPDPAERRAFVAHHYPPRPTVKDPIDCFDQLAQPHNSATLERAVNTWPIGEQTLMLAEECGELITAASHVQRGREQPADKLPGELADVVIMCGQMIAFYGINAQVRQAIKDKLDRLRAKLAKVGEVDTDGGCLDAERSKGCACGLRQGAEGQCPECDKER